MAKEIKENKILKRFGRYLILDHLVDGGMAKICRARYLGPEGNKIVAIKMIQPQYSKDENYATMFKDEIKVTMGLIHPNIAQTYNSGQISEQLYVSMEYVDGKNLKQYLERLKERNFVFPVEISIFIISQVCQALHYAHTFTDKLTGKKLKIIHRDVSPHNIMLTYDGAVKVIDFGIAKSDTNSEHTQAGTIKGKLSYLAPEYLDGKDLDPRYDQFAVGITLWELLCSRKLFKASNELAVLKLVQQCKVPPPSSINPNVPKELDEIVLKSLSKDRNMRYQNLEEMNRALIRFLYQTYPEFNASDLGYFAKELFKDEIEDDRKRLYEFGQVDITPFLRELEEGPDSKKSSGSSSSSNKKSFKTVNVKGGKGKKGRKGQTQEFEFGFDKSASVKLNVENKEGGILKKVGKGNMEIASAIGSSPTPPPSSPKANGKVIEINETNITKTKVRKKRADYADDGFMASGNAKKVVRENTLTSQVQVKKSRPIAVALVLLLIAGSLFHKEIKSVLAPNYENEVADKNSPSRDKASVSQAYGRIRFINTNPSQKFFINGAEELGYDGLETIELELDKKFLIHVVEDGKEYFSAEVNLSKGNSSETIKIPEMPEVSMGEIITRNDYSLGDYLELEYQGLVLKRKLPLSSPLRIPAGTHNVLIKNDAFSTKKAISLEVLPNRRTFLQ